MAGSTDFVPFGTGAGANVLSQVNYLASGYATGFVAGSVASSAQAGKALRQSTFVGSGVATFMANQLAINIADDGNLANFATNFKSALLSVIAGVSSGVISFNGRSGAVNLTGGDVTTALGGTPILVGGAASGDFTGVWPSPTVKSGAITNAKMANMGAGTVKANVGGSAGPPSDVSLAALAAAMGVSTGANWFKVLGNLVQFFSVTFNPSTPVFSAPFNFPVAFTGPPYSVVATSTSIDRDIVTLLSITAAGGTIEVDTQHVTGSGAHTVYLIAIGPG